MPLPTRRTVLFFGGVGLQQDEADAEGEPAAVDEGAAEEAADTGFGESIMPLNDIWVLHMGDAAFLPARAPAAPGVAESGGTGASGARVRPPGATATRLGVSGDGRRRRQGASPAPTGGLLCFGGAAADEYPVGGALWWGGWGG